jgi:hypothetical protein
MAARVDGRRCKKPQPPLAAEADAFRPTTGMVRFVRAELELLAKRRPFSQKFLTKLAGVSESQASRWHTVRGFDDWHHDQLQAAAVRLFNQGKVAVANRILSGAPRGAPACAVQFLVPRPEYPPGSACVPIVQRLPRPHVAPEFRTELASRPVQKSIPRVRLLSALASPRLATLR